MCISFSMMLGEWPTSRQNRNVRRSEDNAPECTRERGEASDQSSGSRHQFGGTLSDWLLLQVWPPS